MICVPVLQDHILLIKHEQMAQGIWNKESEKSVFKKKKTMITLNVIY